MQDIQQMKVISQNISSYVIQTADTTQEQDDMLFIYEHTYTVSNDETTYELTIPKKLIKTWYNQDHTTTFTMTDTSLFVKNTPENTNYAYTTTGFYILLDEARSNIYDGDAPKKFCTILWDVDEFLERNSSMKNMNPQPFIFHYNTLTDTFTIGDQVFTRDDTKKAQSI